MVHHYIRHHYILSNTPLYIMLYHYVCPALPGAAQIVRCARYILGEQHAVHGGSSAARAASAATTVLVLQSEAGAARSGRALALSYQSS